MGFKISRQRYAHDNCLYVEIAVGSKNEGKDILPTRYQKQGEGKNLVDPRDAVRLAKELVKRWNLDYADETKKLSVVGLVDKDGKPIKFVADFSDKDMMQVARWAETTYSGMSKCSGCQRAIGGKSPFEHDDLPGACFCTEVCLANRYRDLFGKEAPNVLSKAGKMNKKLAGIRKKP